MTNQNKYKKIMKIFIVIFAVSIGLLTVLSIYRLNKQDKLSEDTSFLMDSFVVQKVYGENGDEVIANSVNALTEFESLVSIYVEDSDVSKINDAAGSDVVKVNERVYNLVANAKEYSANADGRYDVTIAPLTVEWGITGDSPKVPDSSDIEKLLELVDYRDITLNESDYTIGLEDKGQSIDLGGIAKGTACDIVLDIYRENEIKSALISIGGNVAVLGTKPDDSPFVVGIRNPRGSQNDYFATFEMGDEVIATTGDYERFFEQDDIRYHHILDTDTGYPVDSDLMSVSIISKSGELSDVMSTTMFIGGLEEVKENLDNEDYSIIAVTNDRDVYVSSNIIDRLDITDDSYNIVSGTEE